MTFLNVVKFGFVFFVFFIVNEILLEVIFGYRPFSGLLEVYTTIAIVNTSLGLIPAFIAYRKGRSFYIWWLYGWLLFIIATIHAIVIKPTEKHREKEMLESGMKKCPFCAEIIKPDALVCRYCGRDLPIAKQETTENLSPYQKSKDMETEVN